MGEKSQGVELEGGSEVRGVLDIGEGLKGTEGGEI